MKTLLDEVSAQRVEIDFIELRGPAFADGITKSSDSAQQEALSAAILQLKAESANAVSGPSR